MGTGAGRAPELGDDVAGDPAAGLDAKKGAVSASERNEEERARGRKAVRPLDPRRLKVVDECGTHLALTALYGWAPKGQRFRRSVPRNKGKNTTLVAALGWDGLQAPWTVAGAMDTLAFERYVRDVLGPTLQPGDTVILDNLAVHKAEPIRQAFADLGCQVLYLPAYSPDLSAIEEAFSKLKTFLRRVGARTREALLDAIGQAIATVTPQDARGWFAHAGYPSPAQSP